jgi:hypothetical protein
MDENEAGVLPGGKKGDTFFDRKGYRAGRPYIRMHNGIFLVQGFRESRTEMSNPISMNQEIYHKIPPLA